MMATFDTCIKGRPRRDGTWNLKLRITHRRQSRWLPTSITVHADEVTRRGGIKSRAVLDKSEDLLRQVRAAAATLSPFALGAMDVDDVVAFIREELRGRGWRLDFPGWARERIAAMPEGARTNYTTALRSFIKWRGVEAFDVNDIRARDIREWSDSLEPKQAAVTYVSYLGTLHRLAREQFNDPDSDRPLILRNPFEGFVKKKRPSEGQTSIGVEGIQALLDARPDTPAMRRALDTFIVSFALFGINLADLWQLAPPADGWLVFSRKKMEHRKRRRDAEIRIRVPEQLAPFIDRLRARRTPGRWLNFCEHFASVRSATYCINSQIRKWQEGAGWRDFTLNAARHSFGTIAHSRAGVSRDIVDQCLGHNGSLPLTDIYIEKDWQMLNREAAKVLRLFRWPAADGNDAGSI